MVLFKADYRANPSRFTRFSCTFVSIRAQAQPLKTPAHWVRGARVVQFCPQPEMRPWRGVDCMGDLFLKILGYNRG